MMSLTSHSRQILKRPTRHWLPSLLCTGILLLAQTAVQAQTVYRIVGADGKVTFSDKPPVTPGKVTSLDATANDPASSGSTLPYELRQVVDKYPVTLYSSKDCAPCDAGRNLLRTRGIPFSEKTISSAEDSAAYQRISGSNSLPMLALGGQHIMGFSDAEWIQYLNVAGYPEKSKLPAGYRQPAPSSLVAIKPAAVPSQAASDTASVIAPTTQRPAPRKPAVNPANPAGIQF